MGGPEGKVAEYRVLCIQDVFMNSDPKDIAYRAGKEYKAIDDGYDEIYVTDEYGDQYHHWCEVNADSDGDLIPFYKFFRFTSTTYPKTWNPEKFKDTKIIIPGLG